MEFHQTSYLQDEYFKELGANAIGVISLCNSFLIMPCLLYICIFFSDFLCFDMSLFIIDCYPAGGIL